MAEQPRFTLRAIEVFVAVIEEGSLATGAQRLGASPSAVSQQLSNLEAALGARLIDRTARPLALTPAGFRFQRRALAILDEAARAQSELAELGLSQLPQLRLAVIEDLDAEVTPRLVARLAQALPGCNIVARAGPSHQNIAGLESRAADLVVAADIPAPPDWVEAHPLLSEPFVLVCRKGLVPPGDDAVSALMAAPMARYAASQLLGQQIDTHLRRLRLAPPRRFEFDSNHAVMAMVVEAGGWAITTPLGYLHARRFHDALDLLPLPFAGASRTLLLYARRELLLGLPGEAARCLRSILAERTIAPLAERAPWAAAEMRLLGPQEGDPPGGGEPALRLVRP